MAWIFGVGRLWGHCLTSHGVKSISLSPLLQSKITIFTKSGIWLKVVEMMRCWGRCFALSSWTWGCCVGAGGMEWLWVREGCRFLMMSRCLFPLLPPAADPSRRGCVQGEAANPHGRRYENHLCCEVSSSSLEEFICSSLKGTCRSLKKQTQQTKDSCRGLWGSAETFLFSVFFYRS